MLLGQRLSKCPLLTCAISTQKCKTHDMMEQGESKAPLPQPSRGALGAVTVELGVLAGGGRSPPPMLGQGF